MDTVNLFVGILAIVISIISIVLSILFSSRAANALKTIEEKANTISQDVSKRLDDLVKRAAPSEQEKALSGMVPELIRAMISDPDVVRLMAQEAVKRRQTEGRTTA